MTDFIPKYALTSRKIISKTFDSVKVQTTQQFKKFKFWLLLTALLNLNTSDLAYSSTITPPINPKQTVASKTSKIQKTKRIRKIRKHYVQVPSVAIETATLPAVAYGNSWFGISAGELHNSVQTGITAVGEAGGVFTMGHLLGGQIQALDGVMAHNNFQSLDGFFFLRNPLKGLFALHGKYVHTNEIYDVFYGLRGDIFFNHLTVTFEGGDLHRNVESSSFFGVVALNWYVDPNWRLDASYLRVVSHNAIHLGTEYQFGWTNLPGLSAMAGVGAGAHELRYGFLGLRYYFGCNKPLFNRQREDMVLPATDLNYFAQSQNILKHASLNLSY